MSWVGSQCQNSNLEKKKHQNKTTTQKKRLTYDLCDKSKVGGREDEDKREY